MDSTSRLNSVQGVGGHVAHQLSFPLDKIFIDFPSIPPIKIRVNVERNEKVVFI